MKKYNIILCQNRKLIFVEVFNPVTLDLAVSFTSSFVSLGKSHKLSHMVIDIRKTKSISSILDKYLFAYEKAEECGLSRLWRIALLKKVNDASLDFIETVMINAGYQFKIFTNERCAMKWLKLKNKM